jgi:hypothetical protein
MPRPQIRPIQKRRHPATKYATLQEAPHLELIEKGFQIAGGALREVDPKGCATSTPPPPRIPSFDRRQLTTLRQLKTGRLHGLDLSHRDWFGQAGPGQ